ncbi:MAG: hypothetical protein CV087_08295 [Candidatus Brocadia sp. WS118]|nr:MAG: hypothetical protein CV087_08295 [Candidatus Brocadia sp. WS118]
MSRNESIANTLTDRVFHFIKRSYKRGFRDGLRIAETIVDGFVELNKCEQNEQIAAQAKKAIAEAKGQLNEKET